jgi:hypothetical protein
MRCENHKTKPMDDGRLHVTNMDIPDRAIQTGGAREGQSFVLKV